jgi:hypothetical protein
LYRRISAQNGTNQYTTAEVIKNIAEALDTSVDYLLNGSSSDKANATLQDTEVIRYFKEIETLPADDKATLLRVISAFIRDVRTKQAYTH